MKDLDRPLFFVTGLLVAIGLLALYVAMRGEDPPGLRNPAFVRQAIWVIIGIGVMLILARTPFSLLSGRAYPIYVIGVIVLLITIFVAPPIRGARSWIVVGPFRVQPSELFKPLCALALASLLSDRRIKHRKHLIVPLAAGLVLLPMALILGQPDLGSALSYSALLIGVPYVAGLPVRYIGYAFTGVASFAGRIILGIAESEMHHLPTALSFPLMDWRAGLLFYGLFGIGLAGLWVASKRMRRPLPAIWAIILLISAVAYFASFPVEDKLKRYQRLRIVAFISPDIDPRGASYNVLQSMIAVGSGGWLGRGIRGASQTTLGFLPERQTDFIFSAISETFGFIGALAVLTLYVFMIWRMIEIASHAASETGTYLCAGIASVIALHLVINIAMTLGLAPIVGIPLPLLSYGGSSMVATLAAIGLVQSVVFERRQAIYAVSEERKKRKRKGLLTFRE